MEERRGEHPGPAAAAVHDLDLHHRLTVKAASFSGPLPEPFVLAEYEGVVPGLAREIVEQWKAETRHRHETVASAHATDREVMFRYYEAERRGQTFSILAIFGVLMVAVVAMVLDRPSVGIAGLLTGGAAAIWAMRRRSGGPDLIAPTPLDDGDSAQLPAPVREDA